MRIVFMGTPDIAQTALAQLLREGHEIGAGYTRADKPVGRKQILTPPPVKVLAQENRLPVLQPEKLRAAGEAERFAAFCPQLAVVVAYGRILPQEFLDVPDFGCINLHVSLLPRYRGAAPIQWAIINGERESGVTVMQMDAGLDTGPVIAQERVPIVPEVTAGEYFEEIAPVGARLLARTVREIEAGRAAQTPQQGEASLAPPLKKEDGRLLFEMAAAQAHNLIRGCNPWPLAYFVHEDKKVKVLRAKRADQSGQPGEILLTKPLTVAFGEGALVLEHLHPAGSRAMTGGEWAQGRRLKAGERLGMPGD